MGLKEYNRKRNFRRTPEPAGGSPSAAGLAYVVQKHAASHLHFDFRLELGGVLLSWAVPKGPSLDPAERRLAMRTEDHPMDYRTFEGVIPEGQYGGGTVMLWDRGHWEPDGDARRAVKAGKLEFTLHGERLRGGWRLVRTHGTSGGKESWLLMKRQDRFAVDESEGRFVEEVVTSVETGRTMEEIAGARERVWSSTEGEVAPPHVVAGDATDAVEELGDRAAATAGRRRRKAPLLRPDPMLPARSERVPAGDGWLHEMAVEGRRVLARVAEGEASLLAADAEGFPPAVRPLRDTLGVPGLTALLDGVLTVLEPDGTTSATALVDALAGRGGGVPALLVNDLLHLGSWDLRRAVLEDRKALLANVVEQVWGTDHPRVRWVDHVRGQGSAFAEAACAAGLTGVLSRRAASLYGSGTSRDWLRTPCQARRGRRRPTGQDRA